MPPTDRIPSFRSQQALILAVPLIIEKIVKNKIFPELEKPLIKLLLKVPYLDQKVLRCAGKEMHMASFVHTIQNLESQAIHMCHRQHADHTVSRRINEYFGKKYPRSFTAADVKYHVEQPEELAVLNYTSGTTSFSKGVMIPFRSLWSNTQFAYDNLPFIHPVLVHILPVVGSGQYGLCP